MITAYPSGALDYALLLFVVAIVAIGISVLLPLKWGWRGFPFVAAGTAAVLVLGLLSVAYLPYERGQGMIVHLSSALILFISVLVALVFAATMGVRTTCRNGQ